MTASTTTRTTTRTEWALRFGDGTVEPAADYWDAARVRRDHRDAIRAGEVDAADYEPMTLIRRRFRIQTTTTQLTDWEDSHR